MANRVFNNQYKGTVCVLFTSNDSIVIAGNSSVSNVAIQDEVITGAYITDVHVGTTSGNGGFWEVKRGANTIGVYDSTALINMAQFGIPLRLDEGATLVANLNNDQSGTLVVRLNKVIEGRSGPTSLY